MDYPARRLIQHYGTVLLIQGTRGWKNYRVTSDLTPNVVEAAGIAVRVQGLRRYYALLLRRDQSVVLVKALDGEHILASKSYRWEFGSTYHLSLQAEDNRLRGSINGELIFDWVDEDRPLMD